MNKKTSGNFILILIPVLYIGAVLLIFNRCYLSNDNIWILQDIKSNCLVSFMSVTLGRILSFCYLNISDGIPWYGLTLYAFLGISIYLVISSIWKLERLSHLRIPFLIMFLVSSFIHITRIDYSIVSIMLASSSLLALLVYMEKTEKKHLLVVIALGICFSFSYHFRTSGITAALIFTAPAILLGVIRARKGYKYLLVFLIPIAIAIPFDHLLKKSLETESDIRYQQWNSIRGTFHEFPVSHINRNNEKIRTANNWSQNDYNMLEYWMFYNENKYNVETLNNVFEYSIPISSMSDQVTFSLLGDVLIHLFKQFPVHLFALIFTAMLGVIILGMKDGIMNYIYLGYIFSGIICMEIFFRFPLRIAFPILLSSIVWMMYLVAGSNKRLEMNKTQNNLFIFIALIFVGIASTEVYKVRNVVKTSRTQQKALYESIEELEDMNARFFLISSAPPQGLFYEFLDPLKVDNSNIKTIPGAWSIFSPRFYKALTELGIEHGYDIFPTLAKESNVYFVGREEYISLIPIYLRENHGLYCRLIPVKRLSNKATVYKIETL